MIQKHMTSTKSSKYIDVLQNKLLDEYNNKFHSSIKMSPFQASNVQNAPTVLNNLYGKSAISNKKSKF
jgi:hypothetical protein